MFVLITRFSLYVPDSSSWLLSKNKKTGDELDMYFNTLFDESRLNFRMNFLEKITLPILFKASKKHNIVQIIRYSSLLPQVFKNRLLSLARKYCFIVLCEHDEHGEYSKNDTEVAVEYYQDILPIDRDSIIGVAVLDDDDCLSLDYFDRASLYLNKAFIGKALSFGLGVNGVFNGNNELVKITESHYPKVNIGLLRIGVYRHLNKKIVLPRMGSHGRADKFLPVILDSRDVSYFWSRHPHQDTKLTNTYSGMIEGILKKEDLSLDIIRNKFGDELANLLI